MPRSGWILTTGLLAGLLALAVPPAAAQALRQPAAPHYDVVALRVEFQPDTTRFTTGDGTFGGSLFPDGLQPTVDPLPHDAAYFQAHLDFLAHYVETVSDGQTTLTTHLLPEVVRVSQPMGAYSPTGFDADSDAERAKLGALVAEAWRLADAQVTFEAAGLDPARTVFVLFHAGVGRDVELLGTTLDKTPLDLPSLFFDEATLDAVGVPTPRFRGLDVGRTLVIPRTETRPGFNFIEDEPFLLELSTNGLLAASFFNALGVPDLFDTATGASAIGPFGLMDPLGIFAFAGLFPPEPSAWTRYYLGWAEPTELRGGDAQTIELAAAGLASGTEVARAWISPSEYFLVENRHRDPEGDGLVLRIRQGTGTIEQRIENGQEGFTGFDVSAFAGGVVVGVDNYDWAVPGGLDENDTPLLGGILIWHVDERRFRDGTLNTDPARRFLDLEEADSAQDLGFPSDNPFGPSFDQGSPFDFWYEGNPVTVITATGQELRFYENRFGPDTIPSSEANGGGPSFVVLEDFSAVAPTMRLRYRQAAAAEGLAPVFQRALPVGVARYGTGSGLTAEPASGSLVVFSATAEDVVEVPPAATPRFIDSVYVMPAVQPGAGLVVLTRSTMGAYVLLAGREGEAWAESIPLPEVLTPFEPVSPPIAGSDGSVHLLFGDQRDVLQVRVDDGNVSVEALRSPIGRPLAMALTDRDEPIVLGTSAAVAPGVTWTFDLSDDVRIDGAAFGRDRAGLFGAFTAEGALWLLRPDGSVRRFTLPAAFDADDTVNGFTTLADLDGDGRLDALTTMGTRLVAVTQGGALVGGFPIQMPATSHAQPLVATLDGQQTVFVAAEDGYLHAFAGQGRGGQREGFPLAIGTTAPAVPLLHDGKIFALSVEGQLSGWQLDGLGDVVWGQIFGDARNTSFVVLADEAPPAPGAASLIVAAETYNWPNPIRGGPTYLRCMTREDARVTVTIVDAAGGLVEAFEMELTSGTPEEHLWQADVESGVYFARVVATAASGRTETRLVKMAVIR